MCTWSIILKSYIYIYWKWRAISNSCILVLDLDYIAAIVRYGNCEIAKFISCGSVFPLGMGMGMDGSVGITITKVHSGTTFVHQTSESFEFATIICRLH